MPKISIIEKEQIKAAPLSITENIVFVPVFTKNESKVGKYTLYSSAAAFEADFKDDAVRLGILFDKSYVLARTVLETGLKVLVYGVAPKKDDTSYDSFQKTNTSIEEDLDSTSTFISGETKISNVKEYVKNSLKLYNDKTQVTTFIRTVTEDEAKVELLTSEQNTALQGSTGLTLTLSQGETYKADSIKFYKTVEEQFEEVNPDSSSVEQSGANLVVKASFGSDTIVVTKIEFTSTKIETEEVTIELSVDDTGVITITNYDNNTDRLQTINKLEYNIITPDLKTATEIMQAAYDQFYGQSEENTLTNNYIGNRNLYDVKFLTGGGYATKESAIMKAAEARGDCLALLDKEETVKVKDLLSDEEGTSSFIRSKFAAAFFPWCTFELTGDIVGDEEHTSVYYDLPGSAAYLLAYGRSVQSNANWMAASGVTRGVVPGLVAPKEEITEGQMHYLQGDTGTISGGYVNPIMMVGSYGYKIWGNRTTYVDASVDTFFKFLNVRMLLCDINKVLYTAAVRNTFEPNDDVTWINFKAMCSGVLDKMTSGRGLMWYRWQKEKSPQKATIKAKLIIRPIEAVETFELEIFLTEDEITVREAEEE